MNVTNIIQSLMTKNDLQTANVFSKRFFHKSAIKAIEIPKEAKIWYLCVDSKSKTEQLFILRKALFDLRVVYDWIPPLNTAERMKLRGIGRVYALPIPAYFIKNNDDFFTNVSNSHKLLKIIKRRK